jgi:hypothetical protein
MIRGLFCKNHDYSAMITGFLLSLSLFFFLSFFFCSLSLLSLSFSFFLSLSFSLFLSLSLSLFLSVFLCLSLSFFLFLLFLSFVLFIIMNIILYIWKRKAQCPRPQNPNFRLRGAIAWPALTVSGRGVYTIQSKDFPARTRIQVSTSEEPCDFGARTHGQTPCRNPARAASGEDSKS